MEAGFLVIILLIRVVFAIASAAIASSKGRSVPGWFFGGLFLELIGLVIVACLPNLKAQKARQEASMYEQQRLREMLRQEQMKNEAFRQYSTQRLDVHDQALNLDTRTYTALPGSQQYQQALPGQTQEDPASALAGMAQGQGSVQASTATGGNNGRWFYEAGGVSHGPVSELDIKMMLRGGRLPPTALIWAEHLADWTAVNRVEPFRSVLEQ
ncbi:MAG: hypothetical protein BIFFINMI_02873 [Phycisphaerae bacterium]|nr:hypothetical protein [Phycisphaerae bacterium]